MLTKQEIINKLTGNHKSFIELINGLDKVDFIFSQDNKWTAGQQLDHIYRSVSPVLMAFKFPKFVIRILFGKANRPSKNYDDLIKKYIAKLENGGAATGRFVPKVIAFDQKMQLINNILKVIEELCKKIEKYTEQQLNEYLLPHPLLGKLTLREMLYFTIHHVEQHQIITLRNIDRNK